MRFLVGAQLPPHLALSINAQGHDALHTLDLPKANRSTDENINDLSEREQPVVVTKDADFVNSLLVSARPYKLLLISTGNITNDALETLLVPQLPKIVASWKLTARRLLFTAN